jgi:hypothetical protein
MNLKLKYYFFFILFPIICVAQKDFQKISFLEDKVEINVPTELTEMSDEMFEFKYNMKMRPSLVLSDNRAEINLISNVTYIPSNENKIEAFKDNQIAELSKKRKDIKIIESGVKKVDGKNVAYCKFQTEAIDQKVFNYYFFVLFEKNILMFTFNCIEKVRPEWEKIADEIIMSIKIK